MSSSVNRNLQSNEIKFKQNLILLIVDQYLKENNISMEELINMNTESHLDLIKTIKNVKYYNSFVKSENMTDNELNHEILSRTVFTKLTFDKKWKTLWNHTCSLQEA